MSWTPDSVISRFFFNEVFLVKKPICASAALSKFTNRNSLSSFSKLTIHLRIGFEHLEAYFAYLLQDTHQTNIHQYIMIRISL